VLSENSLIDHHDQLTVKVSVNIIYSRRHPRQENDDEEQFEMQWWASKRASLVGTESVAHYIRLVSLLRYIITAISHKPLR